MSRNVDHELNDLFVALEKERRFLVPPDNNARRALRRRLGGKIVQPYQNVYARKNYWESLGIEERHRHLLRTLAPIHPDWVFCSYSAACLLGLEVPWKHLGKVHVLSELRPPGRVPARLQRHQISQPDVVHRGTIAMTSPLQTISTCLLESSFRRGMPIADSALGKLLFNQEHIAEQIKADGTRRAKVRLETALQTVAYADKRSESGGESIARATMIITGFAPDYLQYELADPLDEKRVYRSDYGWEQHAEQLVLGELDGLAKYTDQLLLCGKTTAEALAAERRRESRLSLYGHPIIRFNMGDVRDPAQLARLLSAAGIVQTAPPPWIDRVTL